MVNPMELLPIYEKRVQEARPENPARKISYGPKKSPGYYALKNNYINSLGGAQTMLDFAMQRPLSHIGFDTEFRYDKPGVVIDKRNTAYDPRSIRPFLLSLAMVEPADDGEGDLYSFVLDLRKPEVLPVLKELFRLQVPFVGHSSKVELFCLWQLGIPEPNIIWDTFILEKLLHLGRHHHKYKLLFKVVDEYEQILAKEEAKEDQKFRFTLVAACQRYGVPYGMVAEKKRLQQSFLIHPDDKPFSDEQIDYSAEDAIAASRLYPHQVLKAVQNGLLHHCETIEMAWVTTNARIEWTGCLVDKDQRGKAINRIQSHKRQLEEALAVKYSIMNIRSHKQLAKFFKNCGLLHNFEKGSKVSFDKELLKKNVGLHPAIALLRAGRRASDLLADKLLSPDFVGEDGRLRAEHRQLGTSTGRQTSYRPNFLGLDRVLRPLIVPEDGYGIGEVDWSQVEVGVAAAMYGDDELVRMFNSGDVYSTMAQDFFCDQLPDEDLGVPGKEFKKRHRELRNQMKSCTLGIFYGITPIGLALSLRTTKSKAKALLNRFMEMFPQLQKSLAQAAQFGAIRGYAYTVSGLKRYRGKGGAANRWEKNWLTNHPVQGSAAVVFKAAGNRLDRLYPQYDAHIIIPLHDAFIFEAPLELLDSVSELTSRVMCDTLQEYFPVLRPQVEVNISTPGCWNKDGNADELELWINSLNNIM